jgi:hypothetical protein
MAGNFPDCTHLFQLRWHDVALWRSESHSAINFGRDTTIAPTGFTAWILPQRKSRTVEVEVKNMIYIWYIHSTTQFDKLNCGKDAYTEDMDHARSLADVKARMLIALDKTASQAIAQSTELSLIPQPKSNILRPTRSDRMSLLVTIPKIFVEELSCSE